MENFENKENEIIENGDNMTEGEASPQEAEAQAEEVNTEPSLAEEENIQDFVTEDITPEEFVPSFNPVIIDEIKPSDDNKASFVGLKIFALITAFAILLSMACVGGYFVGKNQSGYKNDGGVNLSAKPKDTDEMTAAEVYEKVKDSVVGIIVYNQNGAASAASGIIYSQDGYIVTNDHIYSNIPAAKFKIYTQDGKEYEAKYVAGDTVSDLAVLKVDSKGFKAAEFGNSEQLNFGENVVAVGRPNEPTDPSSITKGIISAVSRRVQTTTSYSQRLIQTDTPINPGSSGGALVNMYGQIVGITSSKLISTEQESVGYAIPTTTMNYIVKELIEKGKVVSRAKLGITYLAVDSISVELEKYKHIGLYVDTVSEDSDLYGKLNKGDTIIQINGIDITSDDIVLDIIEQSRAGEKITITYITENGKTATLTAKLRANVSESSYNGNINSLPQNSTTPNKDFNFPEGD